MHRRSGLQDTAALVAHEIEFACTFIRQAPHNESPWNYLRGWLFMRQRRIKQYAAAAAAAADADDDHHRQHPHDETKLHVTTQRHEQHGVHEHVDTSTIAFVQSMCESLVATTPTCHFAAALLVDLYTRDEKQAHRSSTNDDHNIHMAAAHHLLDVLIAQDPIRMAYWTYRKKKLREVEAS
jgi:hypothetical protein